MEPLVAFALTSFLFLHIATTIVFIWFYRRYKNAVAAASEYANNVQESLQRLHLLILQFSPLAMAASHLQGVPGAGPNLSVSEEPGSVGNGDSDPDEDDDITTLGEIIG